MQSSKPCAAVSIRSHGGSASNKRDQVRLGFSLIELMVSFATIGILFGLLLPAVQNARSAARRVACSSKLREFGVALQTYHSLQGRFPARTAGGDMRGGAGGSKQRVHSVLSGTIGLLPFLHLQEISVSINSYEYPQLRAPWVIGMDQPYWFQNFPIFECPSDLAGSNPAQGSSGGRSNYVFCAGDTIGSSIPINGPNEDTDYFPSYGPLREGIPSRGGFGLQVFYSASDIVDGLSNTVAMSERARAIHPRSLNWVGVGPMNNPADLKSLADPADRRYFLKDLPPGWSLFNTDTAPGFRWADGRTFFSSFSTVIPPNGPCGQREGGHTKPALMTASSNHGGGAFVLMFDGSIRFISDEIDTGNLKNPLALEIYGPSKAEQTLGEGSAGPSPYGVWGAMGTRASSDVYGN